MPSYTASWRVRRMDEDSWQPTGEVTGIDSIAVARSTNDGNSPLLESGDMDITGQVEEGYYRIEMLPSTGPGYPCSNLAIRPGWSGMVT